jgi:membrane associated rhomboid family serine protease
MIPIRDDAPRLTVPFVTWTLIAINVLVFCYQFSLWFGSAREEQAFLAAYSMVPARVGSALIGNAPLAPSLLPVLTSMFLHGGWMHLIGTCGSSRSSETTSRTSSGMAYSCSST